MKKTEWFAEDVKPVHVGVYETDLGYAVERCGYSHWDGNRWSNQYSTPRYAAAYAHIAGAQDKRWRGLAVKP